MPVCAVWFDVAVGLKGRPRHGPRYRRFRSRAIHLPTCPRRLWRMVGGIDTFRSRHFWLSGCESSRTGVGRLADAISRREASVANFNGRLLVTTLTRCRESACFLLVLRSWLLVRSVVVMRWTQSIYMNALLLVALA